MDIRQLLKTCFRTTNKAFRLVLVLWLWVAVSSIILKEISPENQSDSARAVALVVGTLGIFLADTFLSGCVYACLRDLTGAGQMSWSKFNYYGRLYFHRLFSLRILTLGSFLLFGTIVYGLVDALRSAGVFFTAVCFALIIGWAAFPLYFLLHFLLAPLVLLAQDTDLLNALRKSWEFTRDNLADAITVGVSFLVIFAVANLPNLLYNNKGKFFYLLAVPGSLLVSYADIFIISGLFIFYYSNQRHFS